MRAWAAWGVVVALGWTIMASRVSAVEGENEDAPICRLSATASKDEVTLGERFGVTVVGEGPAGTTWSFPSEAGGEQVELRAAAEASGEARPGTQRYDAAAFALGDVSVPAIVARCSTSDGAEREVESEPISVSVASVLPKDPEQQTLVDVRPPVGVSVGWAFWVALVILVLALGALAAWLWRRRRRTQLPEVVRTPEIPPDIEARQALDSLARSGLLERGDYRGYYIALTAIAKAYLERRLDAPVAEMTSSEMLVFLRGRPELSPVSSPMRDLATVADFIKFARGGGQRDEAERHLASVRSLIEGIERIIAPPQAATTSGASRGAA